MSMVWHYHLLMPSVVLKLAVIEVTKRSWDVKSPQETLESLARKPSYRKAYRFRLCRLKSENGY